MPITMQALSLLSFYLSNGQERGGSDTSLFSEPAMYKI